MTSKTWFLPPDFNFLPDGEIALGTIIKYPTRPTLALATLSEHPEVLIPRTAVVVERNHHHSSSVDGSLEANIFAKWSNFLSTSVGLRASRHFGRSLNTNRGNLEVRSFQGKFDEPSLEAMTNIPKVKKHINSAFWGGKNYVYVITGLLVSTGSFRIGNESNHSVQVSAQAQAGDNGGFSGGGGGGCSRAGQSTHSHETAPGVVYAYRLHVIRPRSDDIETEMFESREAFFTGDGPNGKGNSESMEMVDATPDVIRQDLSETPSISDVYELGDDKFVVFSGYDGQQ